MLDWLLGADGGAKRSDWTDMVERETLSRFLPYAFYDEHAEIYHLTDGSVGYFWEISPVAYGSGPIIQAVTRLLNLDLPQTAHAQFCLFADPYIEPYLRDYQRIKLRQERIVQDNVRSYVNFWRENERGMTQMRGVPLRNFRAFICLKTDRPMEPDTIGGIKQSLEKFGVRSVPAEGDNGLAAILRRLFSDIREYRAGTVDGQKPLRKQLLDGGAVYDFSGKTARIGAQYGRCFTPRALPKQISAETVNRLFGGIMGVMDDIAQITVPFLYVVTVFFRQTKSEITTKAQITGAQKGGAKFSFELERRVEEFQWTTSQLEAGEKFLRFVPIMWLFGSSEDEAREAVTRAKDMWEDLGFAVQDESYLNKILFLMCLPFGFYDDGKNLQLLERDFIAPISTLANLIPVQADFRGAGKPAIPFVGRKGQVITLDLFHTIMNNHNYLVAATSGAGKSFLLNYLTFQYYAQSYKIRIIDLGYSYQKLCSIIGGRFLDVGEEFGLCFNPFDFKSRDDEDHKLNLQTAQHALALMSSSASGRDLDEESINLLRMATRWVIKTGKGVQGVDAAREFLATFPAHAEEEVEQTGVYDFLIEKARTLAFNLAPFCSEGEYGRYFNGKSTFDIHEDDFVVLELDRLRQFPQLFSVVVLQLMNAVTQDLYLGDRSCPTLILFDEAAEFLKDNLAGGRARNFQSVIEAGYRRARKYGGAFGVVVQSLLDLEDFGSVGQVILDNAATKFLLQADTYGKAAQKKIVDLEGFALDLLKSVTNNKPRYSEVMIISPLGIGIGRLLVDPHTYYMFSTAAEDVARYAKLIDLGLTPAEAIEALVDRRDTALLAKRIPAPHTPEAGE
ncbi:TraC family protein [Eilatimonas milleporae]|uniref:Conjugal transfer ATP-binding protein TraC n=1 Tax=Eilatimonas milleporae TaxID=911205 RepID=A0A3M0CE79_9PROT|nr:TraC family protein [Eilatimonas milleporae]RMB05046.1 conjugal transfer ATP-binding protein TraC [Eilatimonas milleporae]